MSRCDVSDALQLLLPALFPNELIRRTPPKILKVGDIVIARLYGGVYRGYVTELYGEIDVKVGTTIGETWVSRKDVRKVSSIRKTRTLDQQKIFLCLPSLPIGSGITTVHSTAYICRGEALEAPPNGLDSYVCLEGKYYPINFTITPIFPDLVDSPITRTGTYPEDVTHQVSAYYSRVQNIREGARNRPKFGVRSRTTMEIFSKEVPVVLCQGRMWAALGRVVVREILLSNGTILDIPKKYHSRLTWNNTYVGILPKETIGRLFTLGPIASIGRDLVPHIIDHYHGSKGGVCWGVLNKVYDAGNEGENIPDILASAARSLRVVVAYSIHTAKPNRLPNIMTLRKESGEVQT